MTLRRHVQNKHRSNREESPGLQTRSPSSPFSPRHKDTLNFPAWLGAEDTGKQEVLQFLLC